METVSGFFDYSGRSDVIGIILHELTIVSKE